MSLREKKSALYALLQTAMDLELATIPPYMTALLSIRPGGNRRAANHIRSVMMEEMLHMALVGNLMFSLGGSIKLGRAQCPTYPLRLQFNGESFRDRQFDIDLMGYSLPAIKKFMQIEMPASLLLRVRMKHYKLVVPGITIGDFYEKIVTLLEEICSAYEQSEVFSGDPKRQIGAEFFWGALGRPVVITDLADAKRAIDIVVRQGEGASLESGREVKDYFAVPDECPHYFRFKEIAENRAYLPNDSPYGAPTGEEIGVDFTGTYPVLQNPTQASYEEGSKLSDLNLSFNRQYSLMLRQLELAFNGAPSILYDAINNGMHGLASIALEMMATPIPNNASMTGAPSYEWVETIP